jgi:hypothetical protein
MRVMGLFNRVSTIGMVLFFCLLQAKTMAQLDSIHWIPPLHARAEPGPQYLYITTPELLPFAVDIKTGDGALVQTISVSNSQPARVLLGNTNLLSAVDSLLLPMRKAGLVLQGEKKFFVNFRLHSDSRFQACDLTCKGRAALGKIFRIGHMYQSAANSARANFIGVMATEDSTLITLSEFDAGVELLKAGNQNVNGPQNIALKKGESVVFAQYLNQNAFDQPPNGLIGALLESNKPIAVNVGSWLGAPVGGSNDIGVDQIADIDEIGEEYILCKGNGADEMETPVVIAHYNNTQVWLNGSSLPIATLAAGQHLRIQGTQFSANENLYIRASQPVYVYQIVGGVPTGNDIYRTGGLIFVPPISCSIPNSVDNIFQPNQIGDMVFDGGLMIVAMRDSALTVKVNGQAIAIGSGAAVQGYPEFVTYRNLPLFSSFNPPQTASVVAQGAIQVALFGRNGAAGYGAFYSGFSKTAKPSIQLSMIGDGVCPDTIIARGRFDGVQWYYADSLISFGPDTMLIAYAPGTYIGRGYLGVCRRTDFKEDSIRAKFNSPQFPYTFENPSCFGFSDGEINLGNPGGGLPPYQFSINGGQDFKPSPIFDRLPRGDYKIVVRDSTGCYNRPFTLSLTSPDSFAVRLYITSGTEPKPPGETVNLSAEPTRKIVLSEWQPIPAKCPDCLQLSINPVETGQYRVLVTDEKGCTATDEITVGVIPPIYAPNVIRTASKTGNDVFTLFSKDPLPIRYLRIYDRWGGLLFESRGSMTNDPEGAWDGRARQKEAVSGVFVFEAEVEYLPGKTVYLKGDVTVIQ